MTVSKDEATQPGVPVDMTEEEGAARDLRGALELDALLSEAVERHTATQRAEIQALRESIVEIQAGYDASERRVGELERTLRGIGFRTAYDDVAPSAFAPMVIGMVIGALIGMVIALLVGGGDVVFRHPDTNDSLTIYSVYSAPYGQFLIVITLAIIGLVCGLVVNSFRRPNKRASTTRVDAFSLLVQPSRPSR